MPLKPETLDKFAVDFSGIVAKMSPEDVEGIKARLASKLNGGIGVADMLLTAIGETEGEPEPVTASGARTGAVQRMSGRKPTPSPEATPTSGTALLASANAVGVMQGHAFTDKWQLAESIAETLTRSDPPGAARRSSRARSSTIPRIAGSTTACRGVSALWTRCALRPF